MLPAERELLARPLGDQGHLATELGQPAAEAQGEGPVVRMPEGGRLVEGLPGKRPGAHGLPVDRVTPVRVLDPYFYR